jgi:hypothetical protein
MTWVFAVPVAGFVLFLVVGAVTGHVKVTSCCGVADPHRDARLRDAFCDVPSTATTSRPAAGGHDG